ncbi:CDI toxin immunity protein [Paenibacillus sp. FSL R5-0914]|uniref:CDI toxin immunity protein n=1 Tax=Paenibacillus sp. FSL R5-0914 TaxID=2921665 RepID=UPI0030F77E4F
MNREERKKRLEYLVQERKKHEEKLEKEKRISEMLELFPEKDKVDILDESESDKIESKMTDCFPIGFWGRIDWEKVNKKNILTKEDILNIPTVLSNQSLDTSVPVYLIVGIYKYPLVKTSLFTILESIEDIMDMGPDQWIYSPSLRYVIEFCHDEVITIGWI